MGVATWDQDKLVQIGRIALAPLGNFRFVAVVSICHVSTALLRNDLSEYR